MVFMNPLFLALGLAAVAVPITVHLMAKRRARVVPFSTLRFLIEVDRRLARRNRLREILLLLLRTAALALLALGLARPFIKSGPLPGSRPECARVIILDDSASMTRRLHGRSPFESARDAARFILEDTNHQDPCALLTVSEAGEGLKPVLIRNREELEAKLDRIEAGFGADGPNPAFRMARDILNLSPSPKKEIVFLTDLQKGPWTTLLEEREWEEALEEEDLNIRVFVPFHPEGPNLSLVQASASLAPGEAPDRVHVRTLVRNQGREIREARLRLHVDGSLISEESINLAPGGEEEVLLNGKITWPGLHRGAVRLGPDLLDADNTRYFLFETKRRIRVLLALSGSSGNPYYDSSYYISRALAPSSPGGGANSMDVESATLEDLAALAFEDYDAVILLNPRPLSEEGSKDLARYVRRGGGLLILAGSEEYGPDQWPAFPDLLPVKAVDYRSAESRADGYRLEPEGSAHPLLQSLARTHPPTNLGTPRFFGYMETDYVAGSGETETEPRILMRFRDGDSRSPALWERRMGKGRILFLPNDLSPSSSDFALKVSFVPFLHAAVYHLSLNDEGRDAREVGDGIPGGGELVFVPEDPEELETKVQGPRLLRPGFYHWIPPEDGGEDISRLAVNVNPDEGDLETCDLKEAEFFQTPEEAASLVARRDEEGAEFMSLLLFAALLLFVAEPLLANRRFGRTSAASPPSRASTLKEAAS